MRVYTRGARALAGHENPLSVCTVLKDMESGSVYHPYNALKVKVTQCVERLIGLFDRL